MSRLRKKLELDPSDPKIIKTVWGGGYIVHARGEHRMTRFLPRSLFGQTLLILLAGLIVSHAIGSWIYTADREQAVRAVGGFATAQRIANLDAPGAGQRRQNGGNVLWRRSNDQTFRVALAVQPPPITIADG